MYIIARDGSGDFTSIQAAIDAVPVTRPSPAILLVRMDEYHERVVVNKDKVKSMKQMRQVMNKFQERNGSTQCKQLKGVGTKVVLRNCPDCVADAAEFLEELIQQETV